MKSLHGSLHDRQWIRFHGLLEFASSLPLGDGLDAKSRRPWLFLIFYSSKTNFRTNCKAYSKIKSITYKHHQIILSNWYSLRPFILNQILPSFPTNKICNDSATRSILTSHYAWRPVTTSNGFPNTHGTAFGWESRVLTITRSRLLAHVWSSALSSTTEGPWNHIFYSYTNSSRPSSDIPFYNSKTNHLVTRIDLCTSPMGTRSIPDLHNQLVMIQ